MTEFHLAYPTIETQDPEHRLIAGQLNWQSLAGVFTAKFDTGVCFKSLKRLIKICLCHIFYSLTSCYSAINRGYYMAARRYEIYLRVLKNISLVRCAHS